MPTDGETPDQPPEDEMLPDEAAILPDRGRQLDEADKDDLLTVEEAADELGIGLD